jgi:DnaJ family protein C protein 17
MAEDKDLKDHALNTSHDFYELLGVPPIANDSAIRTAYRKTALKYHPDKVGNDQVAIEKFHLLQIAYDVLSDENVRQLYDNARRAREEKKERDAAYEGRRRALKEDLERREGAGAAGTKRKREEFAEEEAFQRELKRLAADGARRRKEREDMLRQEARKEYERDQAELPTEHGVKQQNESTIEEIDRTISLRYPAEAQIDRDELSKRWSRFGKIQDIVLRTKKLKVDGAKHRKEYTTAIIVYTSIVGAHAAVNDFPRLIDTKDDSASLWTIFESVNWASGQEPECIPSKNVVPESPRPTSRPTASTPNTPLNERIQARGNGDAGVGGLKKVPSFSSFKGSPKAPTPSKNVVGSPSMEELTQIRLKNAERRRLAEKLKKEEEEEDAKVQRQGNEP